MKKTSIVLLMLAVLALLLPARASAQDAGGGLQLSLVRTFGYGGFGEIQGSFTLKITNPPAGLAAVEFFMDGEMVSRVGQEPFQYKFHTGDFPEGEHQMSAAGFLPDGTRLESNRISKVFLSSEQAWDDTQGILAPLLIGLAALTILGIGLPLLLNRPKDFVPGRYGPAGGAVCPRCQLPFSRSLLAPNLLVGKLTRCPHCGKFSLQARAPRAVLEAAEARYAGEDLPDKDHPAGAGFDKLVEDSRFED